MFLSQKEMGISDKAVFKSIINIMKNRVKGVKITEGILNVKINEEAMDKLDYLRIENAELKNLDFLKHFRNLDELSLVDVSGLENIAGVGYLSRVKSLYLDSTCVNDISPVEMCTEIENFEYCLYEEEEADEQMDYSFLYRLPNLKTLDLSECGIKNISFLSSCANLEEVSLSDNPIQSIYPLAKLEKLKMIEVERCGLTEIEGVDDFAENKCLEQFFADGNKFSSDKIDYYKSRFSGLENAEFEN